MFTITGTQLLIAALVSLAGYNVAKFAFKKDTEKEQRRRAAGQLAAKLKEYGLVHTPEFLIDYSVGDYSGMAHKIGDLARLFLSGEQHVVAEFAKVFDRTLDAKLVSPEGRAYIAAKLKEFADAKTGA